MVKWIRQRHNIYSGSLRMQCECADSQIIPNKWGNCNMKQHKASKKILSARCAHYSDCECVRHKHVDIFTIKNQKTKLLWYINDFPSRTPVEEPLDWEVALLIPTHHWSSAVPLSATWAKTYKSMPHSFAKTCRISVALVLQSEYRRVNESF